MKKGQVKLLGLIEIYSDNSWQKTFSTFDPTHAAFRGPMLSLLYLSNRMPISYPLFHKFWTPQNLRKIGVETNRYASDINPWFKCNPRKLRSGET